MELAVHGLIGVTGGLAGLLTLANSPVCLCCSVICVLPATCHFIATWLSVICKLQSNYTKGTIPTKLLLQLKAAFREGGLCDRSGTFFYKDHLRKSNVHVLALAGDQDLICPPEAVYETVKLIPEHLVTYKVLGEPGGPHYGHYDLVGGRLAADQVYPCIIEFLSHRDMT